MNQVADVVREYHRLGRGCLLLHLLKFGDQTLIPWSTHKMSQKGSDARLRESNQREEAVSVGEKGYPQNHGDPIFQKVKR